jgi:hypothetical protein
MESAQMAEWIFCPARNKSAGILWVFRAFLTQPDGKSAGQMRVRNESAFTKGKVAPLVSRNVTLQSFVKTRSFCLRVCCALHLRRRFTSGLSRVSHPKKLRWNLKVSIAQDCPDVNKSAKYPSFDLRSFPR